MKKYFTKKRVIWGIIILVVLFLIGRGIFGHKDLSSKIQTGVAKKQNLKLTVLTTGQVVSGTDLDLSFNSSGVVKKVNINAGDKVRAGQVLATLDQASAGASLTTALGGLAQAKANYEKVLAGSSDTQIAVAQVAVQNASTSLAATIAQQNTAVKNAYNTLLNTPITALSGGGNPDNVTPVITGTYTGSAQGIYQISIYQSGTGPQFKVSGLEEATGNAQVQPTPMGKNGLYIQFSSSPNPSDVWTVNIPNTYATTYVANYNAYQTALQTQATAVSGAQGVLAQAQATLNQTLAAARPADIDAAQAAITSAQGQVQSAQAIYNNTIITAPADGTITRVDVKVGELASAQKEVMVLQNVSDLHAEANVSEANIASLQPGQPVDFTFDALGPDRHFSGAVLTVNPASTLVSGVVDYLVKAGLPNIPDIKPGMTANMTILVSQKDNVLSVPQQAIVSQNGNQYVRVIDDPKKLIYHQVQVQTGLSADGGLVEITSGLNDGQQVVTFIKQ